MTKRGIHHELIDRKNHAGNQYQEHGRREPGRHQALDDPPAHLPTCRVAYAVVEFGGLLGIRSKLFAVPMLALKQDAVNKCFVLDARKQSLENAEGFDKDHWPNFADRT